MSSGKKIFLAQERGFASIDLIDAAFNFLPPCGIDFRFRFGKMFLYFLGKPALARRVQFQNFVSDLFKGSIHTKITGIAKS